MPLPEHLEGQSFVPLLKEPGRKWKSTAIGRFQSGDTIRTDQYRFTEYTGGQGKQQARMLYDHQTDPGEDANISEREQHQAVVESLTEQLRAGKGKDGK